jgi:hypothetical protein
MSTAALTIAFDARIGNLETALRRTEASLKRTERQASETTTAVSRTFSSIGTTASTGLGAATRALGLFGTALAAIGVTSGISAALQSISSLSDAAQQLGVTSGYLAAFRDAFNEAGGSSEQAGQAITRIGQLVGDAERGSAEAINTFAALGIAFRNVDGSARSTESVMNDLVGKINDTESQTEKLSLAAELVGRRAAPAFVAAISQMDGSVVGYLERLRALGIVVGNDTPDKIDSLGTAFNRLGQTMVASIADATASMEPELSSFFEWATAQVASLGASFRQFIATSRRLSDPGIQAMQNDAAAAQVAIRDLTNEARALESERPVSSILDNLRPGARTQEAIDRAILANRAAMAEAERRLAVARAAEAMRARELEPIPGPPPEPPGEAAAPPSRVSAAAGAARETVSEMERLAARLAASTRTPLEQFRTSSEEALRVFASTDPRVQAALGGFDTVSRAVSEYAATSYTALTSAGVSSEAAQAKVMGMLGTIQATLPQGSEAWRRWGEVVSGAQEAVRRSTTATETELDKASNAAGKNVTTAIGTVISSIAVEGATLEDAWKKLTQSILKTVVDFVYQMTVQAAILAALKAAFKGFGGILPSASVGGGGGEGRSFAGFPAEGGDSPGAALFSRSLGIDGGVSIGRGLVPTIEASEPSTTIVNVVNNSTGTRTQQRESTDSRGNKTIEVMVLDIVRGGLASGQLDPVMSQSFGVGRQGRV